MSTASISYVIIVGIVRWFFIFAPSWGFRLEEWDKFSLPDPFEKEAKIAHSAINSKTAILSWPPLAFAGIIFSIEKSCPDGPNTLIWPIGIIICTCLVLLLSRVNTRQLIEPIDWLFNSRRDGIILGVLVILDTIILYLASIDQTIAILCRP